MTSIKTTVQVPAVTGVAVSEIQKTALLSLRDAIPVVYKLGPGEITHVSDPYESQGDRVRDYEVTFTYDEAGAKDAEPVDLDLVIDALEVPALGDMPSYDGELN
jgi:hypothetical protein